MATNIIKLSAIVDELVEEKGINKELLINTILEGIVFSYEKSFPETKIKAEYNKKTDTVEIYQMLNVVDSVENKHQEIILKRAKHVNENIIVGEILTIPFDGKIGRIEISRLRQYVGQKFKEIETEAIYNEFKDKENTIVTGVVNKVTPVGASLSVYNIDSFLPRSLMIQNETLTTGDHVKVLIKEVYKIPKGDEKILLDRSSTDFVKKLLEIEIPEIFEGIVKIENIARISGYKTKVLVSSREKKINPVGTCIGSGGSRIKPILRELKEEKLDLIAFSHEMDKETLVANSLKPAEIQNVTILNNIAYVKVADDQRSVAVGKQGKNVLLASKLIDIPIEIINNKKQEEKIEIEEEIEEKKEEEKIE